MLEQAPQKPIEFIKDLKEFELSKESLFLSAKAKNIDRLKELQIKNLWLVGAKEKDLQDILRFTHPKYLDLYQVLAKDLSVLEILTTTVTINLHWNTKSTSLW